MTFYNFIKRFIRPAASEPTVNYQDWLCPRATTNYQDEQHPRVTVGTQSAIIKEGIMRRKARQFLKFHGENIGKGVAIVMAIGALATVFVVLGAGRQYQTVQSKATSVVVDNTQRATESTAQVPAKLILFALTVPPTTATPPTARALPEEQPTTPVPTASATRTPSSAKPPASYTDARGVEHRRIPNWKQGGTLSEISMSKYGIPSFAVTLAWFNRFDNPQQIREGDEILLPPLEKMPMVPPNWPEIPTSPEWLAKRGLLDDEIVIAETEATNEAVKTESNESSAEPQMLQEQPAAAETPQEQPAAPATAAPETQPTELATEDQSAGCKGKRHVVLADEATVWDVAKHEYQLDLYDLGPAIVSANLMDDRTKVVTGETLTIPCLSETGVNPNLVAVATATAAANASRKETRRQ